MKVYKWVYGIFEKHTENRGLFLFPLLVFSTINIIELMWFACTTKYQQAVEEDVDEDPQRADNQVEQVVQELHVHDHGLVSACEGSSVPNEAH